MYESLIRTHDHINLENVLETLKKMIVIIRQFSQPLIFITVTISSTRSVVTMRRGWKEISSGN